MANAVTDKLILSGSTDGRNILTVATASPGTTIHTGPTVTSQYHEVYLYAYNSSATAVTLTIQWGGTTAVNDDIKISVPPLAGEFLVVPGLIIRGNATPLVVRAYAGTANVITLGGYYHLIA